MIGTAGTIAIRRPFRPDRGGASLIVTGSDGDSETIDVPGDSYLAEVDRFAQLVERGESDEADLELTRRTVAVTSDVLRAAAH